MSDKLAEQNIRQELGDSGGFVGKGVDELEQENIRDPLTGLYNRRQLEEDLQNLKRDEPFSVMFVDVDNFKRFNDKYGHDLGDTVLTDVARATLGETRAEQDRVYRYGGEEILVLLKGDMQPDKLLVRAESVRKSVKKIIIRTSTKLDRPRITVSIGVAIKGYADVPENVIKRADAALHLAKTSQKDCVKYLLRIE